jgi:hypothetical protein
MQGQDIINKLRAFNAWRDDFLIECSTLFLMIGFVAGTVDVLTSDGLSQIQWFNLAWAIVQAIAIDGLFFAVWGKIRRATWSWATCGRSSALVAVGLLLAIVASLVNGLLSYQELNGLSDVRRAMVALGIDQATFTYARAILVVLVSILVALFCREATEKQATPVAQATAVQITPVQPVALPTQPQAIALPVQATAIAHSPDMATQETVSHEEKATEHSHEQATQKQATDSPQIDRIVIIHSPVRDRIKQAMIALPNAGYQAIADHANCGYSTVKKYATEIKMEARIEKSQSEY